MHLLAKACEGRFNDEVQELLSKNRDRAQWANHTCEVCGVSVGAVRDKGKWVPEQHWPSVKYPPRNTGTQKKGSSRERTAPEESPVIAEILR